VLQWEDSSAIKVSATLVSLLSTRQYGLVASVGDSVVFTAEPFGPDAADDLQHHREALLQQSLSGHLALVRFVP
jgi:hypothetical protein